MSSAVLMIGNITKISNVRPTITNSEENTSSSIHLYNAINPNSVNDSLANGCKMSTRELYPSYFGIELAVPEWEAILTAIVLSIIIVLTIIGNILVILSVFTYKPLRIVQNFFIISLAVADLTVAILVLPFNVAYSILGRWEFGIHMCKMWLTCDVLCCTSSILNLCAIALDRYWAITDPINYAQKRTVGRVLLLIAGVWILSLIISSPPLIGWNDWPEKFTSVTPCELTSNRGYVIYSSLGSFYIPLAIMTIVYIEIYVATKRRLRDRARASKINTIPFKTTDSTEAIDGSINTARSKPAAVLSAIAHICCGEKSVPTRSMIEQDQESLSSVTNIKNEQLHNQIEHRYVAVAKKKSRRPKIKDSIKHGKARTKKQHQQHLINIAGESVSERLLSSTLNRDGETKGVIIKDPNNTRNSDTVGNTSIDICAPVSENYDNVSLNITPPQSSAGATSFLANPLQKKPTGVYQFIEEKQKISLSKERRAARTLGIIMGVFVICWLPFFLMYVILPFCNLCCPTDKFKNFIAWLGYINSGLNPVIYTIFNLDYRRAFKRLLGMNF